MRFPLATARARSYTNYSLAVKPKGVYPLISYQGQKPQKTKITPQKRKRKKTKYTRVLVLAILTIKVFRRTPISAQSSITRRLGDRCHRLSSCRRTPTRRLKTAPIAAASPILKATGASGYIPGASAAATLYKQKTPLSTDSGGCCLEGIVEVIHVRGHPITGRNDLERKRSHAWREGLAGLSEGY